MQNLTRIEGDNSPGSVKFWISPLDEVSSVPRAVGSTISEDIVMAAGGYFYRIDANIESLGGDMATSSIVYDHEYVAEIRGDSAQLLAELEGMRDRRFVLIRKDRDGYYKICGNEKQGLTFQFKRVSPAAWNGAKGYAIRLSGELTIPEYFYTGEFETAAGGISANVVPDINISEYDLTTNTYPYDPVQIQVKQGYFDYPVVLKAGSAIVPSFKVTYKGKWKASTLSNVDSYTVERNRAGTLTNLSTSGTNDVQIGDIISIRSIVPTNAALDAEITLRFYHDQITNNTLTLPDEAGNGRYLYVLNHTDQTVSVIDCDSNTVTTTISLTAGDDIHTIVYRHIDKCVYCFGAKASPVYRVIDADPASGTFNTVIGGGSFSVRVDVAEYDYINDVFWLAREGALYVAVGSSLSVTALTNVYFKNVAARNGLQYLLPLNSFAVCDQNAVYTINANTYRINGSFGTNGVSVLVGEARYNHKNGKIYTVGEGVVYAHNLDQSLVQVIVAAAASRMHIAFSYANNKAFAGHYNSNNIAVIDTSTDTPVGSITKGSTGTNEIATRSILSCPYNGLIYAQASNNNLFATGVNKVHVIDPTQVLASMYQSAITVGNMMATGVATDQYIGNQMCFNALKI